MAKTNEFENILNECLDRLFNGETIEACLNIYPQYADQLKPLLQTALETRQAALVTPRAEFRQRAANEFQTALRDLPVKKASAGFRWQASWVAPLAIIVVLLAGGGSTVAAATNALPDSPLYNVKLATESVQMAFTFSDQAKTELYARFIDNRVEEIVKMVAAGNYELVEKATDNMNVQLVDMANNNANFSNLGGEKAAYSMMAQDNGTQGLLSAPPVTTTATTTTEAPASYNITSMETVTAENRSIESTSLPTVSSLTTTELIDIEQLRQLLTARYEENLRILWDLYDRAPAALQPAILKAIETLQLGYEQALANLG
jgi:hypothetical protein